MIQDLEGRILSLLQAHKIMSIATVRPDGWPQVTTVGYANEGLDLYFLCAPDSQKAVNLARDDRVSLTIDHDTAQVMEIQGLSMAARAILVTDPTEAQKALRLILDRYEPQAGFPTTDIRPEDLSIFKVTPTVISVLDYSKGFGHTDLVTCDSAPWARAAASA